MVLIDEEFKNVLIKQINSILEIDNLKWNVLTKKIKLKYIHRLCNYLENEDKDKYETLTIPLKSLKPKKIIQFCGISKTSNKELYLQFNKNILEYTFNFRKKYINITKRQYYTYNNLPKVDYDNILNEYNKIVFLFLNTNKIDIENLIKNVVGQNSDKILTQKNNLNYNIYFLNNSINIKTEDFTINFTLNYTNNNITNNIPVNYYIKLINNF
jgi:hypothetical protein